MKQAQMKNRTCSAGDLDLERDLQTRHEKVTPPMSKLDYNPSGKAKDKGFVLCWRGMGQAQGGRVLFAAPSF